MGVFDYECGCNGKTCVFKGGQDGGNANVIIEISLNDDTSVFAEGMYDSYGSVTVGEYTFLLRQFEDYFEDWYESEYKNLEDKVLLAKEIWTTSYYKSVSLRKSKCFPGYPISKLTDEIISKCIRVYPNIK